MKTINTVVATMALSTLSFGVFAAEPVTASQAQNMNKIGVVSADGASTLDALEAKLAEKAAAAGASGYSITSATNNNKLSGTAVIYKSFVSWIRRLRYVQHKYFPVCLPTDAYALTLIDPMLPLFARPPLDGLFLAG